ncbi:MAG: lysoplasmalogenase [Treponema sp.]|jgi:uncharacterized membrane protein YhhN|nr:lysoplasmalogenase [Treponema sp.]
MIKLLYGLFAADALIHLASSFFSRKPLKWVTKILLLPLLLAIYLWGTERFIPAVIPALFFGWCGDILLLKGDDRRFFTMGLVSFLLGHLSYIPAFLSLTGRFNLPVLLVSLAAALPLGIFVHILIRPDKAMTVSTAAYEVVIELMAIAALQLFLFRNDSAGMLIFGGGLFFLISDTILACFTFRAAPRYGSFLVMLTYIAAQGSIVTGLIRV